MKPVENLPHLKMVIATCEGMDLRRYPRRDAVNGLDPDRGLFSGREAQMEEGTLYDYAEGTIGVVLSEGEWFLEIRTNDGRYYSKAHRRNWRDL